MKKLINCLLKKDGISAADFANISSSAISSITTTAWTYMPASIVNTMTNSQLTGLSSTQVSALLNSPNYSQFSSSIQMALALLSIGSSTTTTTSSTSSSSSSLV